MTYRDELEAARQRADALERELEEKERALADKARKLAEREQLLAEKDEALAEAKEDLEAAVSERKKVEAKAVPAKAREALEALATKGKKPKQVKAPPREKPAPSAETLARRRVLKSVTLAGNFMFDWTALVLSPISLFVLGGGVGALWLRIPWYLALPLGASLPILLSFGLFPLYAQVKLAFARRWPGTLPYRLEGYPELLAIRPRRCESKDPFRIEGLPDSLQPGFDPEGHTTLRLVLRFAKDPPAELATILRGFDPDLRSADGGGGDGDAAHRPFPYRAFTRESPVSENYSKHGSRLDNLDDNQEVNRWVRRLHRNVLRHLAAANGLLSADISLR